MVLHEQADFKRPISIGTDTVCLLQSEYLFLDRQVQEAILSARVRPVDPSPHASAGFRMLGNTVAVHAHRWFGSKDPDPTLLVFVPDPPEASPYLVRQFTVLSSDSRAGLLSIAAAIHLAAWITHATSPPPPDPLSNDSLLLSQRVLLQHLTDRVVPSNRRGAGRKTRPAPAPGQTAGVGGRALRWRNC